MSAAYEQEEKKVKAEMKVVRALDHAFPEAKHAPTEVQYMN